MNERIDVLAVIGCDLFGLSANGPAYFRVPTLAHLYVEKARSKWAVMRSDYLLSGRDSELDGLIPAGREVKSGDVQSWHKTKREACAALARVGGAK